LQQIFQEKNSKKRFIKSYLGSPKINQEAQTQTKVIAMILIIPVILCEIDTSDDMCHL
jgi:hypothetical protein